mmetsp:Transcript_4106/g.8311  ORF Transcript_4106/g.8311 Transcript_4106/m.8311 type:complete len:125 (-) Transcript_4106:887-1261(-)
MDIHPSIKASGRVSTAAATNSLPTTTTTTSRGHSVVQHPYTVQHQGRSLLVPRSVVMGNEASRPMPENNNNTPALMKKSSSTSAEQQQQQQQPQTSKERRVTPSTLTIPATNNHGRSRQGKRDR